MADRKAIECSTCGGALQKDGGGARCAECGSQFVLMRTAGPAILKPAREGQAQTALRRAQKRLASLLERLATLSAGSSRASFAPDLTPPRSRAARVAAILLPCFVLIWVLGGLLTAVLVCTLPLVIAAAARSRQVKRFGQEVMEYRRRQGEASDAQRKKLVAEVEQLQRERNDCGDLIHRISERAAPDLA